MSVADLQATLTIDTSQFDKAMDRAEETVDRLTAKIERLVELRERLED